MGNHTATRARGGRGSGKASGSGRGAGRASARWQGGGGEPATTFLDHTPVADSARATVYASPIQRAAIHLQALGTVGMYREAAAGFDEMGRRIFTKAGSRNELVLTRPELDVLRGHALLHNHPAGNGINDVDLLTGARNEMTMHVVGAPPLRAGADPTQEARSPVYLYTMRYGALPAGIARGSAEHADWLVARAARIRVAYDRLEPRVHQQMVARVRAGRTDPQQATLAFYHQMANQVAAALPDDLSYTWEILS